jgi:hypothetical protein
MASEVLFTIWQGGQLNTPVRTTLAKVKTILGADYTLAMLCGIIVFSRVWEGSGKRQREVLAIQVLNCRKKGGWGRELPTSVWRQCMAPSCG